MKNYLGGPACSMIDIAFEYPLFMEWDEKIVRYAKQGYRWFSYSLQSEERPHLAIYGRS